MRGFKGLDAGDRVRVELIGTDVERGFIDFGRAGRACLPVGRGREVKADYLICPEQYLI